MFAALPRFVREKADEVKFIGRQAARGQRGDQSARARHRLDAKAGGESGFDHALARIADAWRACIGDERDFFAPREALQDFFASFGFVELEVTQQRLGDAEMFEQLAGMTGVFCRDDVAFAQGAQRAQGHVFEIANGRRDQIKGASAQRRKFFGHTRMLLGRIQRHIGRTISAGKFAQLGRQQFDAMAAGTPFNCIQLPLQRLK